MQKYFKLILILLIPIIVYLSSFGILVYDSDYYSTLTAEYSSVDASQMNKDMVEYFKTGLVPSSFSEFNEKERVHLKDVRDVIQSLLWVLMASVVLFVFLLRFAKDRQKIIFYGGIITVVLPILFFLPFDLLFTQMHNLFFKPGSWVFASNALLVILYTQNFFFEFAKSIILSGFCLGLVITILSSKLYSLLQ